MTLLQDLKYAVRSFRRSPVFALTATATISLGLGATASIFGVVNAVLLTPLPFEDPGRLVMVRGRWPVRGVEKAGLSTGNLADFIRDTTAFEEFAGLVLGSVPFADGDGDPEQVRIAFVTPNFFSVMGIRPAIGRAFQEGDTNDTVILSHEFWSRRFGADAERLGADMRIGDEVIGEAAGLGEVPSTIVGILPPGFVIDVPEQYGAPTTDVQVWRVQNWDLDPASAGRSGYFLRVFARLAEGATLARAQQEADAVAAYSRANFADAARVNTQFDVLTVHSQVVDAVSTTLLAFLVSVGFVLLIACANVANLLLVRSKGREREIAVRAALGAGRARIVRQILFESILLSLAGAGVGLAVARLAVGALVRLQPEGLPRLHALQLDMSVVAFALGAASFTAVLFGLAPALLAARTSISTVLRQAGPGTTGHRTRLGRHLIVAEVALSLILLVGAGLLLRSFYSLSRVTPGFRAEEVLTFRAAVGEERHAELMQQLREIPGVVAVGAMSQAPLAGAPGRGPFVPDTIALEDTASWSASLRTWVTPGYFEALGIRLLSGRTFTAADLVADADGQIARRVVVDRTLAERTWPGIDAVGRTLHRRPVSRPEGPWEIVGVVDDVHQLDLRETGPGTIYFLLADQPRFAVRAQVPPETLVPQVRQVVGTLAPATPVHEIRTMASYVDENLAPDKFVAILATVFAATALLLAAVGLYGVISYAVSQRMREMGVRLALGARRADLTRLVVGDGIRVTLVGAGLGLVGAVVVARLLRAWLYDVTPSDPLTYVVITGLLVTVAALACYLPALRAARTDPIVTLRSD